MARFLWRRTLRLAWTLLFVTFVTALLIRLLPGDPALEIVGLWDVTPERLDEVREELALDEPIHVQYANWLGRALTGDLGDSYRTRQPVATAIRNRLPMTIELMVWTQVVAISGGLLLGALSARVRGSRFDQAVSTLSYAALSAPHFIVGILLIFAFSVQLGVLPSGGYQPWSAGVVPHLRTLVLPTITLALIELAIYTRLVRSEMIDTLAQDFVLFARGKGLGSTRVLFRHALRPASLPVVTLIGVNIGALIGGAVIVETIFALPGLGRLVVESIHTRDYLMVQGTVAVITVGYVVVNFLVDLTYGVLEPRIRHAD